MFIYIAIATLLFIFAAIVKKTSNEKKIYLGLSILLVLFDGLRWESGSDWDNYYQYFQFCLTDTNDRFELGYVMFNKAIRAITSNYTVFLLTHAFLLYFTLGSFFRQNSIEPLLSLALYFTFFVSYQGMNRQFIAVCFCLLAFNNLVEGKKLYSIAFILIGSQFHLSAFFFLIGLFLVKQFRVKSYIVYLIVAIILGNLGFVKSFIDIGLSYLGPRISYLLDFYSQKNASEFSLFSLLFAYFRRLLIIIPFLMYLKDNKVPKAILYAFNFYYIGFIIYVLFNGTVLQVMVSRGNVYFMIFECILIPYLLHIYRKVISRPVFLMAVYAFAILNMTKGIQSYDVLGKNQNPFIPYKSLYYNTNVQKNTK